MLLKLLNWKKYDLEWLESITDFCFLNQKLFLFYN